MRGEPTARTSRAPRTRSKLSRIARLTLLVAVLLAFVGAAASAAAPTGFYGCRSFVTKHPKPVVEPGSLVLACADANLYLTRVRWSSWSASSAAGRGALHQNDCTPSCAAGRFRTTTAAIVLSRARTCRGKRVFTRISWTVHGKTQSLDFGC